MQEGDGMVSLAAVGGENRGEDAELNLDLSLQVAERAIGTSAIVCNDSVGASSGGGVMGLVDELASSSPIDAVGAINGEIKGTMMKKKKIKKKVMVRKLKAQKEDAGGPSVVTASIGEEHAEAVEKLEVSAKAEEVVGPVDDKVVEVPDNLELRKLLRGPRYFDPPSSGWTTCYNCGEEGHIAVNCTSKRKRKPCFVCGSLDHHGMQCAKGLECFICKKAGHRARDCSDKQGILSEDVKLCLNCGESGHDMFSCGNDYHPDDLKEIQCYVCNTGGHLCCVNYVNNKTTISCFRCGKLGHDGLACTRLMESDANTYSAGSHSCKTLKRDAKAKRKKKSSLKTAPPAAGKTRKQKKSRTGKGKNSMPQKSRGGWLTEHPGDYSHPKMKKYNWNSPSTPSLNPYNYNLGAQSFQGAHNSPGLMLWIPGSHGHPARTYDHPSSTYGPSGSMYAHHNIHGHTGSMYGHHNSYGHSGGAYGHPMSRYGQSSSSYDPARTYGNPQRYGHHSNMHGNFSGGYDNGRDLFGSGSSSRPRWNYGR